MEKGKFIKKFESFRDKRIRRVIYYELDYGTERSFWNEFSDFDTIDHGIDLEMTDNSVIALTWSNEFYPYGISVADCAMSEMLTNYRSWDVTNDSLWTSLVNRRVEAVRVFWNYVVTDSSKIPQPQTLGLFFKGKQMCLYQRM